MAATDATHARRRDVYATLNLAMDHLLANIADADSVAPLPPSVPLRHSESSLLETWSELQTRVADRRKSMLVKQQQRAEKRRAKLASAEAKAASMAAAAAAAATAKDSVRNGSSTSSKPKKLKSEATRSTVEPPTTSTTRKTSNKAAKLSPRRSETAASRHAAVATSPHTKKDKALSWSAASAATSAPPPPVATKQPVALTKLRELPTLRDLVYDTPKYNALVKWLNCDMGKNASLSRELELLLAIVPRTDTGTSRNSKRTATDSLPAKLKTRETLDDRLRNEKAAARTAKRVATHKRKRSAAAASDDDDDEDPDDGDEPEYADGYSDSESESDEAEATIKLDDPASPKLRTRDITGGTKRYATSERAGSTANHQPPAATTGPTGSAKSDLLRVAARLKDEGVRTAGASEDSAIVLDDSEEDEDEDEDEDDDEEEDEEVEEEIEDEDDDTSTATPNQSVVADTNKAATATGGMKAKAKPKAKHTDDADADDNGDHDGADASSTDDDQDLFDLNEDDVYVVESILEVKIGRTLTARSAAGSSGSRSLTKEMDLYLVKWDGYDELTWEPETNIPKRLVDLFRARELNKCAHRYKITAFYERKVVKNVTTGTSETIYYILWEGEDHGIWECRSNLPEQVVLWLEKTSRSKCWSSTTHAASKKKAATRA